MARHNTHRAPGFAKTGLSFGPAGKTACGVALAGAATFSAMGGAQAAPTTSPAADTTVNQAAVQQIAVKNNASALATTVDESSALNFTTKLRKGSQGGYVSTLQAALNNKGANLNVDGKFGWRTKNAVMDFQSSNNLRLVDGVVGPETRGALNGGSSSAQVTETSSNKSSSSSSNGTSSNSILSIARSQIGTDYRWAASNPGSGFDCSGFTKYVYSQVGIDLPHSSSGQKAQATRISQSQAQPGDLVSWPGHVGIYAGNGKVIDAGRTPDAVTERSIWGNPTFYSVR